ncbi:SatD family protein [Halorubrum amylolyticum]|uniref:SatD family protein n=1 Tax=Halorubrum amylolyticum TaxID=2508724 RepID=UPI00100914FF|nr:SatD family protein [Halorubrum amylolyticum]
MSASGPQYVLLADVIGSSDIDDRAEFRENLTLALDRVNREFSEYISSNFEMLKGIDEFGGVLSRLAPIYEIISMIHTDVHPTMVRFGISGGQIDIQPSGEINELDGPAFHQADSLLTQVEQDDLFIYLVRVYPEVSTAGTA